MRDAERAEKADSPIGFVDHVRGNPAPRERWDYDTYPGLVPMITYDVAGWHREAQWLFQYMYSVYSYMFDLARYMERADEYDSRLIYTYVEGINELCSELFSHAGDGAAFGVDVPKTIMEHSIKIAKIPSMHRARMQADLVEIGKEMKTRAIKEVAKRAIARKPFINNYKLGGGKGPNPNNNNKGGNGSGAAAKQ